MHLLQSAALATTLVCGVPQQLHLQPQGGIATPKKARAVALLAADEVYGHEIRKLEWPFKVSKTGTLWIVEGSLNHGKMPPPVGGVVQVKINSSDGTIYEICHGE